MIALSRLLAIAIHWQHLIPIRDHEMIAKRFCSNGTGKLTFIINFGLNNRRSRIRRWAESGGMDRLVCKNYIRVQCLEGRDVIGPLLG